MRARDIRDVGSEYIGSAIITSRAQAAYAVPKESRNEHQPLAGQESSSSPCSVPSRLGHWVYLNRTSGKVGPGLPNFSSPLRRIIQPLKT